MKREVAVVNISCGSLSEVLLGRRVYQRARQVISLYGRILYCCKLIIYFQSASVLSASVLPLSISMCCFHFQSAWVFSLSISMGVFTFNQHGLFSLSISMGVVFHSLFMSPLPPCCHSEGGRQRLPAQGTAQEPQEEEGRGGHYTGGGLLPFKGALLQRLPGYKEETLHIHVSSRGL